MSEIEPKDVRPLVEAALRKQAAARKPIRLTKKEVRDILEDVATPEVCAIEVSNLLCIIADKLSPQRDEARKQLREVARDFRKFHPAL